MKRGLLLKFCLFILTFIFSVQYAFSLEGNAAIEKRVTITNLYPDTPQYTGDYFFVGSYEQETGTRKVIANTLLKFNTNQFKGTKISKAELALKSKNIHSRALAYAGKPLTLGIYKMYLGDWEKASWNTVFMEDYEFSGRQIQVDKDGEYILDITPLLASILEEGNWIMLKSMDDNQYNLKQFEIESYVKVEYEDTGEKTATTLVPQTASEELDRAQPEDSDECEMNIFDKPSMDIGELQDLLKKRNSPLAPFAENIYSEGIKQGIDPAYAMAFFLFESSYGKAGVGSRTKNPGNVGYNSEIADYKPKDAPAYSGFNTWEKGISQWFSLIKNYASSKGLNTVEEIVPYYKYGPKGLDGSLTAKQKQNVEDYISNIKNFISEYKTLPQCSQSRTSGFRETEYAGLQCLKCPDVNSDDGIDIADLQIIGQNIGSAIIDYDLNSDGNVDESDMECVSDYFADKAEDVDLCKITMEIATTKQTYNVNEKVELTSLLEDESETHNPLSNGITGRAVQIPSSSASTSSSSSTTTSTIPPVLTPKKRLYGINDIEELSSDILTESMLYSSSVGSKKKEIESSIAYKSSIRKEIMKILLKEDTGRFLDNIIQSKDIDKLPNYIKNNIEKEIQIKDGDFEIEHIDDFENPSNSRFNYYVSRKTGGLFGLDLNFWIFDKTNERFNFRPVGDVPNILSSSKVNVKGYVIENELAAEISNNEDNNENNRVNTYFEVTEEAKPETLGPQRVAIILIKAQGRGESDLPTREEVAQRVFNGMIQDFYKEASYGKMSLQGSVEDVYGWYDVDSRLADPHKVWITDLLPIVDKDINFKKYDRVMIGVGGEYGGMSSLGKKIQITDDGEVRISIGTFGIPKEEEFLVFGEYFFQSSFTFAHEFGHSLGVVHANAWDCGSEILEGYSCEHIEYGNVFDVMGKRNYGNHFNARFKEFFNWLTTEQVLDIQDSGSYYLKPLEKDTAIVAKVHNENPNSPVFYLEYRQPIGFDEYLDSPDSKDDIGGMHINWMKESIFNGFASTETRLLDMKPEPNVEVNSKYLDKFSTSALMPGETFEERLSGIKITNDGEDRAGEKIMFSVESKNPECTRKFYIPPLSYMRLGDWSISQLEDSIEMQRGSEFFLYAYILNFDAVTCSKSRFEHKITLPSNFISSDSDNIEGTFSLNFISDERLSRYIKIPEDESLGEHEISVQVKNLISGQEEERKVKIIVTDPYDPKYPIIEKNFGIVLFDHSDKNLKLTYHDFNFANNNGVKHEGVYKQNFRVYIQSHEKPISKEDFNLVLDSYRNNEARLDFKDAQLDFIESEKIYCTPDIYNKYICTWYSNNNLITVSIIDKFQDLKENANAKWYIEAYNAMKEAYLKKYPSDVEKKTSLKCEDTDNGKYVYKKGILKANIPDWDEEVPDRCGVQTVPGNYELRENCDGENCYIVELYCENDMPQRLIENCKSGCNDGSCIKPISQIINNRNELLEGLLNMQIFRKEGDGWVLDSTPFSGNILINPSEIYYLADLWGDDIYVPVGSYKAYAKLSDIRIGERQQNEIVESEWEFEVVKNDNLQNSETISALSAPAKKPEIPKLPMTKDSRYKDLNDILITTEDENYNYWFHIYTNFIPIQDGNTWYIVIKRNLKNSRPEFIPFELAYEIDGIRYTENSEIRTLHSDLDVFIGFEISDNWELNKFRQFILFPEPHPSYQGFQFDGEIDIPWRYYYGDIYTVEGDRIISALSQAIDILKEIEDKEVFKISDVSRPPQFLGQRPEDEVPPPIMDKVTAKQFLKEIRLTILNSDYMVPVSMSGSIEAYEYNMLKKRRK